MEERTLLIIKPNITKKNKVGEILSILEKDFTIKAIRSLHLRKEEAAEFYKIHKGKDFFEKLITFMSSGKIVAVVLSGKNAVKQLRTKIGKTDPKEAEPWTIRALYGDNKTENAVHAAAPDENPEREIKFFFPEYECVD